MLTKLSTFSGVSTRGEPLVQLFHQGDSIQKVAAGYRPEIQEWLGTYKSDLKKIALLVNAMGASEYYGQNKNGDIFYWGALAHDSRGKLPTDYPFDTFYGKRIPPYGFRTFLDAHPYVHHRNKDPSRTFGQVAVSVLNPRMKRIELVVLIDRELAAVHDAQPFVDRVDAGEFPDVSMGTRVPYDRCVVCNHKSKTTKDYCDHIKTLGMNFVMPDGRKVGVINDYPRFFDISFVFIGADRTAKVMCKLASGLHVPESVAEAERVYDIREEDGLIKAAGYIDSPDEVRPVPKFRKEFTNRGAGYGDGVLRTNAADGTDSTTADEKLAAFEEVVDGPCAKKGSRWIPGPDGGACTVPSADRGDSHRDEDRKVDGEQKAAKANNNVTANFEVKGHPDVVERLKKLLAAVEMLGNWGSSRTIKFPIDGDGPEKLTVVKGLDGQKPGNLGELTNKDEFHASSVKWKGEEKSDDPMRAIKEAAAKPLKAPPHRDKFPLQGQYKWNGMTILVENAKGTWRRGKDWQTHMKFDYGEIQDSLGSDGDPVDVYVGPNEKVENVYIVHQNHVFGLKKGEYDEDKVMLGFKDADSAKKAYLAHYDRPGFFRSITTMPLAQFKKVIFRKESNGEKIAKDRGMEKKAIDLKLEDLFDTPNAVRRERVWKDKSTGDSSYHVGSGLGKSFKTMQKTASVEDMDAKLAEVFKISDLKTAEDKLADILKDVESDDVNGKVVENLTEREKCISPEILNSAAKGGLENALATPSMMGMVLKPEEFQRILLSAIGKTDLADELDSKGVTFGPSKGCCAPCKDLGPGHFDSGLMQKLLPMLSGRSYLGPVVRKRIVRITITPKAGPSPTPVDSPLLSKVGAAYNWYRTEMLKAATYAPEIISQNPGLHSAVYEVGASDLFSKNAEFGPAGVNWTNVGTTIASVPLSLMYSASLRKDIGEGQDVGTLARLIADHPYIFALGSGVLVRELMKNEKLNRIVGNTATEIRNLGKRIVTGGA